MKHVFLLFITLLIASACAKRIHLGSAGTLYTSNTTDTIPYKNVSGMMVVSTEVNGKKEQLIFDTGADILLLGNDARANGKKIRSKSTDSNGAVSHAEITKLDSLKLPGLKYADIYAMRAGFPKLLLCLGDGLIGNNLIARSHWKITDNYLIRSDMPFTVRKETLSSPYFLYGSYRFFSNFTINQQPFDTCLIDYAGRFEIDVPMKYYAAMLKQIKLVHKNTQVVSSHWGISGKSVADTSRILNCTIELSGQLVPNVNIRFSNSFTEKRIGVLLLRRFTAVYIDHISKTLFFETPLRINAYQGENYFSVDLEGDHFIVDGMMVVKDLNAFIKVGDALSTVNGKKATDFSSYCDFFDWLQKLKQERSLTIVTRSGQEMKLFNPN